MRKRNEDSLDWILTKKKHFFMIILIFFFNTSTVTHLMIYASVLKKTISF